MFLESSLTLRPNSLNRSLEFPRKNGHPKKFELHRDNTPKSFFDSKPSVFSVDCKRFQYTQRWVYEPDLRCGNVNGRLKVLDFYTLSRCCSTLISENQSSSLREGEKSLPTRSFTIGRF